MGLNSYLTERGFKLKSELAAYMNSIRKDLIPHVENATFPNFVKDAFSKFGLGGVDIPKKYGGSEFPYTD